MMSQLRGTLKAAHIYFRMLLLVPSYGRITKTYVRYAISFLVSGALHLTLKLGGKFTHHGAILLNITRQD